MEWDDEVGWWSGMMRWDNVVRWWDGVVRWCGRRLGCDGWMG